MILSWNKNAIAINRLPKDVAIIWIVTVDFLIVNISERLVKYNAMEKKPKGIIS